MDHAWTCACCGKQYNTLPEGFACEAPDYWRQPAENEVESRNRRGSDFCVVDEHFFIRACVEIPVIGRDGAFIWGVWASLSRESFERAVALHDQDIIKNEPPRWLGRPPLTSGNAGSSRGHRRSIARRLGVGWE